MGSASTRQRVGQHLHELAEVIGARPPGSPANARATAYVRRVLEDAGLRATEHPFRTRWWEPGAVELVVGGVGVAAIANPYSRPAEVDGVAVTLQEAEAAQTTGGIVILGDDLAPEPLMPRAFPFFQPAEHADLLERVEAVQPAAVVTVSRDVPILEDPDLAFPSVTVPPEVASRLRAERACLRVGGAVHDGAGVTVSTRSGPPGKRVVVSAHVDSKVTTPGAFDNAGSVAALLAWVEAGLPSSTPLEVVFFNGEDHFDSGGEQAWLAATELSEVSANVNLDGAGLRDRRTSAVLLGGSPSQQAALASFLATRQGWEAVPPWFESDHGIFAMQGIPAIAITSAGVHELLRTLAHTSRDTVDVVDVAVLADIAASLDDLVAVVAQA